MWKQKANFASSFCSLYLRSYLVVFNSSRRVVRNVGCPVRGPSRNYLVWYMHLSAYISRPFLLNLFIILLLIVICTADVLRNNWNQRNMCSFGILMCPWCGNSLFAYWSNYLILLKIKEQYPTQPTILTFCYVSILLNKWSK